MTSSTQVKLFKDASCDEKGDNGPASSASISYAQSITKGNGMLYFSTSKSNIRALNLITGIVTHVCGVPGTTGNGDGGSATNAILTNNIRLTYYKNKLFLTDGGAIRVIDLNTNIITRVAGVVNEKGIAGDNGQAETAARFSLPLAVAFDSSDNMYISDADNGKIRVISYCPDNTYYGTMSCISSKYTVQGTCPAGYYAKDIYCVACPPGSFSYGNNSLNCATCPENMYSSIGASQCSSGSKIGTSINKLIVYFYLLVVGILLLQ